MKTSTRLSTTLVSIEDSLRKKIKVYKKRAAEIENYLKKHPDDWEAFQCEFNLEVNRVFVDIVNFEKASFSKGRHGKVEKLKRLFTNRIRKIFLKGVYNEWSLRKPFGYAGDFRIIDDIYQNKSNSKGFVRLFDNYFLMSAISVAVRNRKEDFKKNVVDFIKGKKEKKIVIMDLACGPCRDVKEILSSGTFKDKEVIFDCYDHDKRALEFAMSLLDGHENVNFIRMNALKIAAAREINKLIKRKYDLIFSTGLLDYFNYKVSVRLIANLRKLLNPGGVLAISDVREKYTNPSVHYMEWVGDWNLIYRKDNEFKKIFLEAGFMNEELKTQYEQQKIMQYMIATNKR